MNFIKRRAGVRTPYARVSRLISAQPFQRGYSSAAWPITVGRPVPQVLLGTSDLFVLRLMRFFVASIHVARIGYVAQEVLDPGTKTIVMVVQLGNNVTCNHRRGSWQKD